MCAGDCGHAPCRFLPYFATSRKILTRHAQIGLKNRNVAKLASTQYLSVHSLPQEDRYDTDDASAREIDPILVAASTMCLVQSSAEGNIARRSWTGTPKHIERRR